MKNQGQSTKKRRGGGKEKRVVYGGWSGRRKRNVGGISVRKTEMDPWEIIKWAKDPWSLKGTMQNLTDVDWNILGKGEDKVARLMSEDWESTRQQKVARSSLLHRWQQAGDGRSWRRMVCGRFRGKKEGCWGLGKIARSGMKRLLELGEHWEWLDRRRRFSLWRLKSRNYGYCQWFGR